MPRGFEGRAGELPEWEQIIILEEARAAGIDPRLLAALRLTEQGGPGREFGVVSVSAPTYGEQARIAAQSIRNSIGRYEEQLETPAVKDGRVTEDFIQFFSARYAPLGAENDPRQLNRFHAPNLIAFYENSELVA